jgi:hypothetical protein
MFANDITLGATEISKAVPSSARLPRLLCFHSPAQARPGEDPDHLVKSAWPCIQALELSQDLQFHLIIHYMIYNYIYRERENIYGENTNIHSAEF